MLKGSHITIEKKTAYEPERIDNLMYKINIIKQLHSPRILGQMSFEAIRESYFKRHA